MLEIKKLEDEHIDSLCELEEICFSVPWSRESFVWAKNNENAYFIVAIEDGRIIGYAGLCFVLDEGDIANVATSPEHRRRGVAAALMSNIVDFAKKKGIVHLMLEVRASNAGAIALYEKFGFTKVAVRKNYYSKPTEDADIMRLEL